MGFGLLLIGRFTFKVNDSLFTFPEPFWIFCKQHEINGVCSQMSLLGNEVFSLLSDLRDDDFGYKVHFNEMLRQAGYDQLPTCPKGEWLPNLDFPTKSNLINAMKHTKSQPYITTLMKSIQTSNYVIYSPILPALQSTDTLGSNCMINHSSQLMMDIIGPWSLNWLWVFLSYSVGGP